MFYVSCLFHPIPKAIKLFPIVSENALFNCIRHPNLTFDLLRLYLKFSQRFLTILIVLGGNYAQDIRESYLLKFLFAHN